MVRLMAFCDRTLGNSSLVLCYDSVLCAALLWVLSDCPGQRSQTLVVSLEAHTRWVVESYPFSSS